MAAQCNPVGPIVELTDIERREKKRADRAVRRLQLQIGQPFRPYDLFDQVLVIPEALIANADLSAGEKLTWMALASALGRAGDCFPSCATLGRKLGVERKQVRRWLDGLVSKQLVRRTARPPEVGGGDWDTNLYELLWHPIFEEGSYGRWGQNVPTRGDKLSLPGGGKSSHKKNHHHQKGKIEKSKEQGRPKPERKSVQSAETQTGERKPFNCFPDDDDGKPKREPLDDPTDELRLRFTERFRDASGAILQTIVDELNDRQALKEFVAFDDAHTGAPPRLKNPGGYYRALVQQFRAARVARIEAEHRESRRVIERSLGAQELEERPICELGLCNGGGELRENGKYRPCDCAAGQKLSPKVREMMEALNRGAA